MTAEEKSPKSEIASKEEKILEFWREKEIFKKTLEKKSPEEQDQSLLLSPLKKR